MSDIGGLLPIALWVGLCVVVVPTPFLHLGPGAVEAQEPVCVQAFRPELPLNDSMKALSVGLPGREKSSSPGRHTAQLLSCRRQAVSAIITGCRFSTGGHVLVRPIETRYARSDDVRIAYQVIGQGPFDLVLVPGFISNLDLAWEDEGYTRLLRRLSAFSRLILFDKRGTGLSDRVDIHSLPSLETRMDDVRAVMDAAGSGRAAILGASEGGPMAMLFAATYPERTRALALYGGYANFHKWVMPKDRLDHFIETAESAWGSGATLPHFAPGRVDDARFSEWWARFERLSASPTAAIALARMNAEIDVRSVLPNIDVPTLLIHRRNDARVDPGASRSRSRDGQTLSTTPRHCGRATGG